MNALKIFSILLLFASASAHAEDFVTIGKVTDKAAKYVSGLIPGEGLTEVDITVKDSNLFRGERDGEAVFQFNVLAVRDILSKENSNLFTQFSLHSQEINNDQRTIGNLGLGYRFLNSKQSMMFGANTFYDQDWIGGHKRVGVGLEAKAALLNFNYNLYQKATNQIIISDTKEQVLSGQEYNINSQVPYMPWATINYSGYRMENEKALQDVKGAIYSLEMDLSPSLRLTGERDVSSVDGQEDISNFNLAWIYPPRKNKSTLLDGATTQEAFVKKDMQATLKDKVRRNNNLAVEIQGTIIFTSK